MGVFHVFEIAQMLLNRATHHKLRQKSSYRLHEKFITNYGSSNFLKLMIIISVNFCYKLRQLSKLLQIKSKLLQITPGITNCGIITNCVHCVKSVHIRSFPGSCFHAFGPENFLIRTLFTQWL